MRKLDQMSVVALTRLAHIRPVHIPRHDHKGGEIGSYPPIPFHVVSFRVEVDVRPPRPPFEYRSHGGRVLVSPGPDLEGH